MPDQDWATEKAQDIYGGTHGDCCCDKHAQDDVGMIACALRDAYQKGCADTLETACRAVCIHCTRNLSVQKTEDGVYRHTGLSYAQNLCDAWPIRAAAEKEESRGDA